MMITRTKRELIMIHIFGTYTPLNLFQFLTKAAWGITKTLEDATDGTDIAILTADTILMQDPLKSKAWIKEEYVCLL